MRFHIGLLEVSLRAIRADMSRETSLSKIEEMISHTLQRDFTNVEIVEVRVWRDIDADDDDVLRIDVVFKGKSRDLDARKVSGAVRHVRPGLQALGEMAFPLISFVTQGDAGSRLEPA